MPKWRSEGLKICANSPLYKAGGGTHSPAPMNLAAIDWLPISINLLLVLFVIVCLLMVLLILMQRPKQEGLGAAFGANVTDQVFGARTTNVLQRGTVYLGSSFFILALVLSALVGRLNQRESLLKPKTAETKVEKKEEAPKTDEADKPKSLTEELPAEDKTAPAPVAPETPAPAVDPAAPKPEETTPPAPVTPPADAQTPPAGDTAPADGAGTPEEKSSQP